MESAPLDPATSREGSDECHRSYDAYPYQVKAARGIADADFTFGACSGAQVANLMSRLPGAGGWNEGAQLSKVTAATTLVTLSVGGNDAGFTDIALNCLGANSPRNCDNAIAGHQSDLARACPPAAPKSSTAGVSQMSAPCRPVPPDPRQSPQRRDQDPAVPAALRHAQRRGVQRRRCRARQAGDRRFDVVVRRTTEPDHRGAG